MDQDQMYSIGSLDLREDALDDMLCRICLQSDDPDILEQEAKRDRLHNELIHLYMPWKIQLLFREELVSTLFLMYIHTAQVLHQVNYFNQPQMSTISLILKTSMLQHHPSGRIMKIFLRTEKSSRSCMHIFDGPMAHITNGKVKTNMFLIWAGPDGKDIYENLQLSPSQQYNLYAVFEAFERYCEPICNFHAARFKFRVVKQHATETINTFYHRILCLARQCQFENINEHLIDAIVYGCKSKKAQDKLLQMPIWMMLEECLLICRDYKSLQRHINTVKPTGEFKAMVGLAR